MVHCGEEISPATTLPARSGSPPAAARVQEFVAEESTAASAGTGSGLCLTVLLLLLLSRHPQVHPGVQLPGPLRLLHHPSAPGLLLPLSSHTGRKTQQEEQCLIYLFIYFAIICIWSRSTSLWVGCSTRTHRLINHQGDNFTQNDL